jgi:HNH endonuclease
MRVKVTCHNCSKEFERAKSKLADSKTGYRFCSRACKESAQSIGGKCPDIRPPHYGTSRGRELLKRWIADRPKDNCAGCDESRRYLLEVHHIDGDHGNNAPTNLEIVCCNCHAKRHLKLVDGIWIYDSHALTPREELNKL